MKYIQGNKFFHHTAIVRYFLTMAEDSGVFDRPEFGLLEKTLTRKEKIKYFKQIKINLLWKFTVETLETFSTQMDFSWSNTYIKKYGIIYKIQKVNDKYYLLSGDHRECKIDINDCCRLIKNYIKLWNDRNSHK
jgi:hypothetical protein